MPDIITIAITEEDVGLTITPSKLSLGSQFDNNSKEFVFYRPTGRESDSLILYIEAKENEAINLGTNNTYAIPETQTQKIKLGLQIAFVDASGRRELSNPVEFKIRASLAAAKEGA